MTKIKPLEWMHPPGVGGRGWIAYPMPGVHMFYRIQKKFANGKFMAHFPTHVHDFDTLEAAQASCNEDWRARVLGCVDECQHTPVMYTISSGGGYSYNGGGATGIRCSKCGFTGPFE